MPKLEMAVVLPGRWKHSCHRMHWYRVSQELKAAKQRRMVPGPKPENQNELPVIGFPFNRNCRWSGLNKQGSSFFPRPKKGRRPLPFNLPGIWISIAGIDLFIIHRKEKLTVRCITTIGAKHFVWWWPVINSRSFLNFGFAFGATGWEFGTDLPWIIWESRHIICPCLGDLFWHPSVDGLRLARRLDFVIIFSTESTIKPLSLWWIIVGRSENPMLT